MKKLAMKALWYKTHFGKSCFTKIIGFSEIGHFFCPFLTFANTFGLE
jgi:hypothetical protein|uniref:Uncharacterized protein n=1 Tax=viral metagenome TaxID=1070528 RepID=A0A6C0HR24_9ZZZZ